MNNKQSYRLLTSDEVAALSRLGNRADDWSHVHVADGFDPSAVRDNTFMGEVYLGAIDGTPLTDGILF